jgi:hypothetical protein
VGGEIRRQERGRHGIRTGLRTTDGRTTIPD